MDKIHVFFSINDDYAKYLSVAMISILKNTSSSIFFHIINSGLSPENIRKINSVKNIKNFEIDYFRVDNDIFKDIPECADAHVSDEPDHKFLVSNIDKNIDKAIILDVDIIFVDDIKKLWDIDITDNYIGASIDRVFSNDKEKWRKYYSLPEKYDYINSGVMVANLKKWRHESISEKLFEVAHKNAKILRFPDQDTFNMTFAPKVKYFPQIFNYTPNLGYDDIKEEENIRMNAVVVHWAGHEKPWNNQNVYMCDEFFKYARLSPFYESILYENITKLCANSQGGGLSIEAYLSKFLALNMLKEQKNATKLLRFLEFDLNLMKLKCA